MQTDFLSVYHIHRRSSTQIDNRPRLRYNICKYAAVAELADARDLKSLAGDSVPVRSRSAA